MSRPSARTHAAGNDLPTPDRLLAFALLGVLVTRPLINETFYATLPAFIEAVTQPVGPTPLATIALDGILLLTGIAVFLRHPLRRIGAATIGFALLGAGVVVSTAFASDKRAAANAGADLLIIVLAGLALARLARARWLANLLVAGVIAAGCTNAVKCITQRAYEFPDTLQTWLVQKEQLAARGVDVNSPQIVDYERRLRSADAFGYLTHPNVTAACLGSAALLGFALLLGCARHMRQPGGAVRLAVAVLLTALPVAALPLTGSLGGMASAGLGAVLLVACALASQHIAQRWRTALATVAVGYLLLILAAVGYGTLRGTLPHPSLAFRWTYWQGAAQVIADHSLTGVGHENFGTWYVRYRPPEATEEVANPHNIWLSLLAELGPLGLLGGLLLTAAALVRVFRALEAPANNVDRPLDIRLLAPALVAALLVHAAFSGMPLAGPGMAVIWAVEVAVPFMLVLTAAAWAFETLIARQQGARPLAAGCAAALVAALVHNLIGFSLMTPAGLSVFILLAAAPQCEPAEAPQVGVLRRERVAIAVAGAAALVLYAWLVALPSSRALRHLRRMNDLLGGAASETRLAAALDAGRRAVADDRWNPVPPRRLGQVLLALASQERRDPARQLRWLDEALRLAGIARQRHPASVGNWRLTAHVQEARARVLEALGKNNEALDALRDAARAWDEVTKRHPTEPRDRIAAAETFAALWRRTHAPSDRQAALEHIRAARRIDAARPASVAARLRTHELQRLDELEGILKHK